MNILFDRHSYQIRLHRASGSRLSGLFDAIEAAGWTYDIGTWDPDAPGGVALKSYDVLVLTTRDYAHGGYSVGELADLIAFVSDGGGLYSMANHAAPDVSTSPNHVRYECAIASTFFTAFEAAFYRRDDGSPVVLEGANLNAHRILHGQAGWPVAPGSDSRAVQEVVTQSFCGLHANAFADPLVGLEDLGSITNQQSGLGVSPGVVWAVALDEVTTGRVVFCADSGWICDPSGNPDHPSGLFEEGDNAQLALNTLAWLGRL